MTVEPLSPTDHMTYDGESRMTALSGLNGAGSYMYDGNGLRVARSVTGGTTMVSICSGDSIDRRIRQRGSTSAPSREYIAGPSGLLAMISNGATTYYHQDHLSVRLTTDGNGNVVTQEGHFPFGEPWYQSGPTNKWFFTGKERDAESGNDYFGARYFGSSMGRFLSPDPSGLAYADPTNPQSLNLYSYVLNNPLHNIDPSGMECVWDDGSYDSADDKQTGSASGCSGQGGTWVDPNLFEGVEGNQYGSWSGQGSSSVAFDWLTPSATVNGNTPWTSTDFQAMGQAWLSGSLPQQLNYGPWTAETIDISHNFAVNRAVQAYIKAGCPASGTPANSFAAGHYEAAIDSVGNIVLGQPDWLEMEVGGFSGTITGDGDTTNITVNNSMSNSSFKGDTTFKNNSHAADNPNGPNGPRHNVQQTFKWTEQGLCQH